MNMSKKCKVIYTLVMNIPVALSISLTAQLLATGTVIVNLLLLNFGLAYVISFCVGMLLPVGKWGFGFAMACKAKPDTLKFGLLATVVINFVYVLVNSLILTFVNVILLAHAQIIAYFIGIVSTFVQLYIVGYIVSFLWNGPAEKIAKNICGE